MTHLIKILSI